MRFDKNKEAQNWQVTKNHGNIRVRLIPQYFYRKQVKVQESKSTCI